MERVTTNGLADRICEMLRDEYLTGAEAQKIRCAVGVAEGRAKARQQDADRRAVERVRAKLAAFELRAAPGAIPPRPWTDADEQEAVLQGQDGPDPEYVVAPRFGGVECRSVPAPEAGDMCADWGPDDLIELAPGADALAPVYAIQAQQAALSEQDRCPLTGDAPADPDDDPEDTPIVPFTEQEGE